jgi:hypothetical protein
MTFSFCGTIASYISRNWELTERLVDFKCLESKDHKGVYAARSFVDSASNKGGLNKISLELESQSQSPKLTRWLLLNTYHG